MEYEYAPNDSNVGHCIVIVKILNLKRGEVNRFYLKQLFANAEFPLKEEDSLKDVTLRFVWTRDKYKSIQFSKVLGSDIVLKMEKAHATKLREYSIIRA